jgi:hypothetical protein
MELKGIYKLHGENYSEKKEKPFLILPHLSARPASLCNWTVSSKKHSLWFLSQAISYIISSSLKAD